MPEKSCETCKSHKLWGKKKKHYCTYFGDFLGKQGMLEAGRDCPKYVDKSTASNQCPACKIELDTASPWLSDCENCGFRYVTPVNTVPDGWYVGAYAFQYGPMDGLIHKVGLDCDVIKLDERACGDKPAEARSMNMDRVSVKDVLKYFPLGPINLHIKVKWTDAPPVGFPNELIG